MINAGFMFEMNSIHINIIFIDANRVKKQCQPASNQIVIVLVIDV